MAVEASARIDERLRALAREAVASPGKPDARSDPALAKLRQLGTELWLDTGNLEEASALWTREFSAVTTNNTLANQVVQTGAMDEVVREAAREILGADPGIGQNALIMELGFVVNCHIALRLVKALGCMVSVELHPSVADSVESTVEYAERYHAVCPERFYIKIPLTPEGYCSVARVRAKGIPVNYTLGFSARQNYLAAAISNPSFVNVFLGRLNSVVSDNGWGDGKNVGEKATLATQQAVCELRDAGKTASRLIAASMRDPQQVEDLAGVDVFTMPPKVARGFVEAKPDAASLVSRLREVPEVAFHDQADTAALDTLWTVDDRVRALAEDLRRRNAATLDGNDIRRADDDHGTGLFHRFTGVEVLDIQRQGKIPDLARWRSSPGVALDDLMTQSALQSFATDQAALDDHLRRLVLTR